VAASHEDPDIYTFLGGDPATQAGWLAARGYPPATLLALHNACALRCFFCAGPGTIEVPAAEVTSAARAEAQLAARPDGVDRLLVGGNEPTLHPEFERLLVAARPAGFRRVELMTNGAALRSRAADWARRGVAEVVVPLYGADAATHDGVVGAAAFTDVLRGLDAALQAGIAVRVHTLLLRRTLGQLGALAALVQGRWGTRLGVALLRDKGRFDFAAEAPRFSAAAAAVAAVPFPVRPLGIGVPRCLPTVDEPPPLVAELYFRSQARVFGPGCTGCAAARACGGVVAAYAGEVSSV